MRVDLATRWVWTFYLATTSAIVASVLLAEGGSLRGGHALGYLAIQTGLFGIVSVVTRLRLSAPAMTWVCGALGVIGLPVSFTAIGMILPSINPEPWEWVWLATDRAAFGFDPTVRVQALLVPWLVELLQLCYAMFYLVPIAAVLVSGRVGGPERFARALVTIVLGFQISYIGYLIWPTLPPYRFLDHGPELEGLWLALPLRELLDAAEANRWDCFPSGHTMLSVLPTVIVWRYARTAFPAFLVIATIIVFSTVALRYHYVVDVAAGLLGVPLALWMGDRVFDAAAARSREAQARETQARETQAR